MRFFVMAKMTASLLFYAVTLSASEVINIDDITVSGQDESRKTELSGTQSPNLFFFDKPELYISDGYKREKAFAVMVDTAVIKDRYLDLRYGAAAGRPSAYAGFWYYRKEKPSALNLQLEYSVKPYEDAGFKETDSSFSFSARRNDLLKTPVRISGRYSDRSFWRTKSRDFSFNAGYGLYESPLTVEAWIAGKYLDYASISAPAVSGAVTESGVSAGHVFMENYLFSLFFLSQNYRVDISDRYFFSSSLRWRRDFLERIKVGLESGIDGISGKSYEHNELSVKGSIKYLLADNLDITAVYSQGGFDRNNLTETGPAPDMDENRLRLNTAAAVSVPRKGNTLDFKTLLTITPVTAGLSYCFREVYDFVYYFSQADGYFDRKNISGSTREEILSLDLFTSPAGEMTLQPSIRVEYRNSPRNVSYLPEWRIISDVSAKFGIFSISAGYLWTSAFVSGNGPGIAEYGNLRFTVMSRVFDDNLHISLSGDNLLGRRLEKYTGNVTAHPGAELSLMYKL